MCGPIFGGAKRARAGSAGSKHTTEKSRKLNLDLMERSMGAKVAVMQAYDGVYGDVAAAVATINTAVQRTAPKHFIKHALRTLHPDTLDSLLESLKVHKEDSRIEALNDVIFAETLQRLDAHEAAITAIKEAFMTTSAFIFARHYMTDKFQWKSYEDHILKAIKHVSRRRGQQEAQADFLAFDGLRLGDDDSESD
jgi:hypothetical protein